MAKKKKSSNKIKQSKTTSLKDIFFNEKSNFIVGLFLIVISIFMIFSFVSYLYTGAEDQSLLDNLRPGEVQNADRSFQNFCGSIGAIIAHFFLSRCFGFPAFIIPVFIFIASLKQMDVSSRVNLWKWFFGMALVMIWTSVFFASYISPLMPDSFFNPGGMHGLFISDWIRNVIGIPGLTILLALIALLFLIYLSSETITIIRNILNPKRYLTKVKFNIKGNNDETAADNAEISPSETDESPDDDTDNEADDDAVAQTVSWGIDGELQQEETEQQTLEELNAADPDINVVVAGEEESAEGDTLNTSPDLSTPIDPREPFTRYKFPTLSLLKHDDSDNQPFVNTEELIKNKDRIIEVLRSFRVEIVKIDATVGPTITLYEITPAEGIRISRIRSLSDDLALNLAAIGVRIIAPIPGKGTIGIEVPNKNPKIVSMESILNSRKFQKTEMALPIALGKTITNEVYMVDLAKIPHLLVAGATGQGKSVGLNAIITSLLYKKHPNELKLVLVDPKKVEFSIYAPIAKHFMAVVDEEEDPIITDVTKVVRTLKSLCTLMDSRYNLLKMAGVRNIKEYNDKYINHKLRLTDGHEYMPYIVVIIDEFGDLIMTAGKEIETPIARIAQLARAVGIHMIIATQRPTTNIITGTIKANFPGRIAFRVSAAIDSRTILDRSGADQLVGRGDMLILNGSDPVRVQCAFIDTPEVIAVNNYIEEQPGPVESYELPEPASESAAAGGEMIDVGAYDTLFEEAARLVVISQQGSTSMIQRKLAIGFARAGRIMDQLENAGIVGEAHGGKPREVLIQDEVALTALIEQIHTQ